MGINMGMYNGLTRHGFLIIRTKTLIYKASFSNERETEYYCHHWGQCTAGLIIGILLFFFFLLRGSVGFARRIAAMQPCMWHYRLNDSTRLIEVTDVRGNAM